MLKGAFHHGGHRVLILSGGELLRVHRTRVDADADGAVVFARDIHQEGDLVLPGFLAFMVVEMSGVVADLVHVGRDHFGQAVVLLQVNAQHRFALAPDPDQRLGILAVVRGDADDVGAGLLKQPELRQRGVHVGGGRGAHALHGDGVIVADGDASDPDRTGGVAFDHRPLMKSEGRNGDATLSLPESTCNIIWTSPGMTISGIPIFRQHQDGYPSR